jgi:hypothetical protein
VKGKNVSVPGCSLTFGLMVEIMETSRPNIDDVSFNITSTAFRSDPLNIQY